MSISNTDTFNGATGTITSTNYNRWQDPLTAGWTVLASGQLAVPQVTNPTVNAALVRPPAEEVADGTFTRRFHYGTSSPTTSQFLGGRLKLAADGTVLVAYWAAVDATKVYIFQTLAGSTSLVTSASLSPALVLASDYDLTLTLTGTSVVATVTLVGGGDIGTVSTTSSSITGAGRFGLANNSADNANYTSRTLWDSSGVLVNADDAAIYYSPYNWLATGSGATAVAELNNPGAYFKVKVTVGAAGYIILRLDTTNTSAVNATDCPRVRCTLNGVATDTTTLYDADGGYQITLGSSLAAGTYTVQVDFLGLTQSPMADRWNTPVAASIRMVGLSLSTGGSVSAPHLLLPPLAALRGFDFGRRGHG
jgi:hypothetical protein